MLYAVLVMVFLCTSAILLIFVSIILLFMSWVVIKIGASPLFVILASFSVDVTGFIGVEKASREGSMVWPLVNNYR